MLTFQRTRIVFLIATLLAVTEYYYIGFSWYYLLQLPVLYFSILAFGSAFIGAGFFLKSICKIETTDKLIALTFDDGPDPVHTHSVLHILKTHKIKATFFLIGKKIEGNEDLVKEIMTEGHVVGNHSFCHSYGYDFYSTKKVIEDLQLANKTIKGITGKTPTLFRPPYGVTNPNIAKAVKQLNLTSIGWNIRSLDTIIQDSNKLYKRVTSRIRPGSILLFHDTGANTIETLKEVILFAQKNGYKIVGLDQLLTINVYEEI